MKVLLRLVLLLASLATTRAAEPAGGDDSRMRNALRDLTAQLRAAQSDLAAAQGREAAFAAEKKELAEKYELLRRQSAADRAAGDKSAAALKAQVAELNAQLRKLGETLERTQAEGSKAAQLAQATEGQRGQLAAELADLRPKLADREARNLALFLLGNEILNRYQEFSLGEALRAKEPFVGRARARLENLIQDFDDQLQEQRLKN